MTTKLTWYGHAALGLETDGHKIVVDPFLNGNPAASISPDAVQADFILIVTVKSMSEYEALTRRLFFQNNNVKHFSTFVAMDRIKSGLSISL